jgi:hypothetical protein
MLYTFLGGNQFLAETGEHGSEVANTVSTDCGHLGEKENICYLHIPIVTSI